MDAVFEAWSALGAWRWLIIAALLFGTELLTGTTWLLWLSVAAGLMAGVVALAPGLPLAAELVGFGGLALAATFVGRRVMDPGALGRSSGAQLNAPEDRLAGARAVAAGRFSGGEGRARLGDTEWRAVTTDGSDPAAGSALLVSRVDGATLIVTPAGAKDPG